MIRTEWPVRVNGRIQLVSFCVPDHFTQSQTDDAAVDKAVSMGWDDVEPFYQSDDPDFEFDPSIKESHA